MSEETRQVTVVGARNGSYLIDEELPDGRLVISPGPQLSSDTPGRPATEQEFARFLAEHDAHMLPADGEG